MLSYYILTENEKLSYEVIKLEINMFMEWILQSDEKLNTVTFVVNLGVIPLAIILYCLLRKSKMQRLSRIINSRKMVFLITDQHNTFE